MPRQNSYAADFHEDQAAGLRRLMTGPKPRIVSVLSATGNGDLPRILTNLAASLQRHGSDVLLMHAAGAEFDALRHYQLAGKPTLADAATASHAVEDAMQQAAAGYSVANLASAKFTQKAFEPQLVGKLEQLVTTLAHRHEIVLVEAALNSANALPLPMLNDGDIVVQLNRKPASIQQAYRLIKQLFTQLGARPFGILVNGANEAEAQAVFSNIAGVAWRYLRIKLDYIGHLPSDEHLVRAASLGRSVIDAFPLAAVSQAFVALANRLDYRQPAAGLLPAYSS